MDASSSIRELKIKTGIVKRMTKEKAAYIKEVEIEKERLVKMKDAGKDEYQVKRQEEVIAESLSMIPHAHKKLLTAYSDLKEALDAAQFLSEREEYLAAQEVLKDAAASLETS
ncbi:tubulin-specific chaperone A-like [Haemaphysalis longicornis]